MSLAKLFNFKYFIQNIKKSKMAIILFLSIVPIFTALTIITTSSYSAMLEFYELGLANIIFMYITPFVLSFSLFGYVYKKKSIDFIGSMPISRKSIFVTNTLGGIILIIISQLITLLISLLIGVFTNGIIFPEMLFDIFLYQTIAYVFVFIVSNLAMSVSGNLLTQIVVTLLVLFIIPVSVFYFDLWNGSNYDIVDGYYNVNSYYSLEGIRSYTAPSMIFALTNSNAEYGFNAISLIKMIILSTIYVILGYMMFEKKKLETAGESFENKYVHMIVKGLTLIPFAMILVALIDSSEWEAISFIIAIIAVYYLVYDLITNKKNKIGQNILAMMATVLVLCSVYGIIANAGENVDLEIELEDIDKILITDVAYRLTGLNYEINDKELIEKIMYDAASDRDYKNGERVKLELKMENGKRLSYRPYINYNIIEQILEEAVLEEFEIKEIEYNENIEFNKEQRNKLKVALNNAIKEKGITNLFNTLRNEDYSYYVYGYEYENHMVRKITYPIVASEEIFNIVVSAENSNAAEFIRKRESHDLYLNLYNIKDFRYYGDCPEELKAYILKNKDVDCNMNKEYVVLRIDNVRFFTNDIENVINIIKNSKEYKKFANQDLEDVYFKDVYYNQTTQSYEGVDVIINSESI